MGSVWFTNAGLMSDTVISIGLSSLAAIADTIKKLKYPPGWLKTTCSLDIIPNLFL